MRNQLTILKLLSLFILGTVLTSCAVQHTRHGNQTNLSLYGFQQEERQKIENWIGLDNLRVIECSIRNCEYWYGGTLSSGDLYQRLQHYLGKNEMNIPSNITLKNGVIQVSRIGVRGYSTEYRQGDQLNRPNTEWVDRW